MKNLIKNLQNVNYVKENQNQVVSQAIKKARLTKNLTLKEASEGICSISYLSKTENNNVSSFSNKYVRRICESVGLDYEGLVTYNSHIEVTTLAYLVLCSNYDKIEEMLDEALDEFFTLKVELLKGFYKLHNNEINVVGGIISNIYKLKEQLTFDEGIMFIILNLMYLIKTLRVNKNIDYLLDLIDIDCKDKYINWLLKYTLATCFFELNDIYNFTRIYDYLKVIPDLEFPFDKAVILKVNFNILNVKNYNRFIRLNEDLFNVFINSNNRCDVFYSKALLEYYLNEYDNCLKTIEKLPKTSKTEALEVVCLFKLGKLDDISYKQRSSYDNIFINAVIKANEISKLPQLTKGMIKAFYEYYEDSKFYNHNLYNDFINDFYFELVNKTSSYKVINSVLQDRIKN